MRALFLLLIFVKMISSRVVYKTIAMPGVTPLQHDRFYCKAVYLDSNNEYWITAFRANASFHKARSITLMACDDVKQDYVDQPYWDCTNTGMACQNSRLLYNWARNAPSIKLPQDIAFPIAGETGQQYISMMIHYSEPHPAGSEDYTGVTVRITDQKPKYQAGILYVAGSSFDIPPNSPKTVYDANCKLSDATKTNAIKVFAYRPHQHEIGTVMSGYLYNRKTKQLTTLFKKNPLWPQTFYPLDKVYTMNADDAIHMRCVWNSTGRDVNTHDGKLTADEHCNLFMLYYTYLDAEIDRSSCRGEHYPALTSLLPDDSDQPLPLNSKLEKLGSGENQIKGDVVITYDHLFSE